MAKIEEIRQAYESFLLRFSTTCRSGDYFFRYDGFTPKIKRVGASPVICVEGILYLKEWPYKVVSRQKKIDILVRGTEHFDSDGKACIYSNVHVNYLAVSPKGVAKVIENVHYDFEAAPGTAHPFFHAQFANNEIGDQVARSAVGFEHGMDTKKPSDRYKNMRVPTAHMNVPSVLLCLAADHMRGTFFKELVEEVRSGTTRLPDASCQRMRDSFADGRDFCKSVHWY